MKPENYADRAIELVTEEMYGQDAPSLGHSDLQLLVLYALLALTTGEKTTQEDVHDAWSLWTTNTRGLPHHPSLVPFKQLSPQVQALDQAYVDAIHRAARRLKAES